MEQVILVPNNTGGIIVIQPAMDCGITIEEIARKDGPAGRPYLIVPASAIPIDMTFFEAFEADFSQPHGVSIGGAAWFIEQYGAEISVINAESRPVAAEALVAATREAAGFPEDFTEEQIDEAYAELLAHVAELNAQNALAFSDAVAYWESNKAARIQRLNQLIAIQQAEMPA